MKKKKMNVKIEVKILRRASRLSPEEEDTIEEMEGFLEEFLSRDTWHDLKEMKQSLFVKLFSGRR